jgi:hypothetical protein
MKRYIKAEIQHMSDSEVLNWIAPETLARIKSTEPKPELRVYCIGQEGEARGTDISFGTRLQRAYNYVKDMIVKIGDKLKIGTAIFNQHIETNEHIGREQIGEVVGKGFRYVKDKLSAVMVAYIYPQYRDIPLDIASIETDVEHSQGSKGKVDVIDVKAVTAVALSSSAIHSPGFPGATLLATVQAFTQKGGSKMELEEIKEAIREGGFKVTDLFDSSVVLSADAVKEHVKKEKQTEYEHAKRVEKALGEEREKVITLTSQLDDANKKLNTANEAVNSFNAQKLFDEIAKSRNLDEKEKQFIGKNLKLFKSDKEGDALKTDFNVFIDLELQKFQDLAKVLGVEIKKPATQQQQSSGVPSSDGKGGGSDATDYSKPENNDLIPQEPK